jgi:hypothetical protein
MKAKRQPVIALKEDAADALIAAATCPMKYWLHRKRKSAKKRYSTTEVLNYCFRVASRAFYRDYAENGCPMKSSTMLGIIAREYGKKFADPVRWAKIQKKITPMIDIFIESHPTMTQVRLTGHSFEAPFPELSPICILADTIDCVYQYNGLDVLCVVSINKARETNRIREGVALIGYKSISGDALPYKILTFTGSKFVRSTPQQADIDEVGQIVQLACFLHVSKNNTRHGGSACLDCGHRDVC